MNFFIIYKQEIISAIYSFFACAGFAILYYSPPKLVITTSFLGMFGWITYLIVHKFDSSYIVPVFLGSFVVGIFGEFLARTMKKPATVFIIPGIIPFVPGFKIYTMMYNIIEQNFDAAISAGSEAFFIGITIASAIIIATSVARMIKFKKKI